MEELLLIVVVVFAIYVYVKLTCKTQLGDPTKKKEVVAAVVAEEVKHESPVEVVSEVVESVEEAAETAPASSLPDNVVRDPKTGELANLPAAYTFAKRWLKEALVEEGLLDKVYKNADLNDEINASIQEAFKKLKGMPKYN